MELSVGMYVRSKINGMIGKITDIEETKVFDRYLTVIREETRYILDDNHNRGFCETENDSVKASYNIKELLQVGDIITYEFPTGLGMLKYENVTILESLLEVLKSSDEYTILSIVTKEALSSVEYRVETN